jgi:hypothetical protein
MHHGYSFLCILVLATECLGAVSLADYHHNRDLHVTGDLATGESNDTITTAVIANAPTTTKPAELSSAASSVNSGAACSQSWDSWIDDALRAHKSIGTITSQVVQTTTPSAAWITQLHLCNNYRELRGTTRLEIASTRLVPPKPSATTINLRAEPSLASLLKVPPQCSLVERECDDAWWKVFRRRPFFSPIWNVADELGPYLESIGVRLFGCHIREEYWSNCVGPRASLDLSPYLPIKPHNTCARNTPQTNRIDGQDGNSNFPRMNFPPHCFRLIGRY